MAACRELLGCARSSQLALAARCGSRGGVPARTIAPAFSPVQARCRPVAVISSKFGSLVVMCDLLLAPKLRSTHAASEELHHSHAATSPECDSHRKGDA